ncbi:DNA-packaging protein [Serratia sp. MYb239]|uniref:head-tail connector protein n=1 Tax=Serratia sp. MYb239 TaxID=2033438 RepID=UPI000CF685DF|nr:head-tail connector protein [Serratia sp. MYb239]AVJ17213.1 DNA-packaging protein [Serratia sp. MYb239]
MIELVALEEAKMHLRIDEDYSDADLTLKIQSGSAALLAYLKDNRKLVVSDDGKLIDGEPLYRVKTALLVLLGYLDRNRGGEEEDKLKQGELPFSVSMLIYDLHCPTIM